MIRSSVSGRRLSLLLALAAAVSAAPPPMEPASRTLFVFVHGINPRRVGAIENVHWSRNVERCSGPSRDEPPYCLPESYCVPRSEMLGKAAGVWLNDIENEPSDSSLFCTLKDDLFQRNYSLRAFTDPGASPVDLAHEVGDREWSRVVGDLTLRPHVLEAMRRHLEDRRDKARSRSGGLSGFEADLLRMHPNGPIESFAGIVEAWPDSVPSRLVVFAHSMGGLSTREYLMSDFYKGDLDKVITFDTPHAGSWVAHYNKQGVNALGSNVMEEGAKIALGLSLLGWHEPWADKVGTFFLVSGGATTVTSLATGLAGYVGNDFLGDEEANSYLTPGFPALEAMNRKNVIGCEKDGCRVPSFVLHTMDGILSPADPEGLLGTGTLGAVLPLEALDAASAMLKAGLREWPGELAAHDVLGNAITAGSFAFGGWNYTNHGSLPVPRFSSSAEGIPFLQRGDVVLRRRLSLWDPLAASSSASLAGYALAWAEASKGAYYSWTALEALSAAGRGTPGMWWPCVGAKIGIGLGIGGLMSVDMGAYAAFAAASHNASIHQTMERNMHGEVQRADGRKYGLLFQEIQYDLHEDPFAQVASILHVGAAGDSVLELRIDTGSAGTAKGLEVPLENLLEIHYPDPGWENRWAVRHERHDPAGGGTRVRQVRRWNLPVEILTTSQPRSIDFQVDDLHPDRMEQMELVLNYGLHRFVWDREAGKDTYVLTYFENGNPWPATSGLPNPIDALGRWHVPLRDLLPSKYQVLLDGQNLMGISLVNEVGRRSAQRQFLTFQAAAPSLAMRFPQPWGVVSDPAAAVRFRADLLHYPGIRFDTLGAAWALAPRDSTWTTRPIEPEAWNPLVGLLASDSIQDLELPMMAGWRDPVDGPWDLALRIPSVQPASGQKGQPGTRRFPMWLDRSAPTFRVEAEARTRGEPWRFRLHWTDLPEGLADVVQLVRLRVVDPAGTVVAELPPLEHAALSGVQVVWDGLVAGREAPDGRYRLEVEGMDGAVADAATLEQTVRLRRQVQQAILAGRDPWTPEAASAWAKLRLDRRLNWGSASREFLVDRTAPVVVPERLVAHPIGRTERVRIPCTVADPGGSGAGVHLRFEFRDAATGEGFAQARAVPAVSTEAGAPTPWSFQEGDDPQGMLPDGAWKVRILFEDAAGNRDSVEIPGLLRVDRTLPTVAQLRASPSYLASRSTESVGPAVVEAGDAASVAGTWISPEGARVGMAGVRDATGLWSIAYPESIRRQRGTWTLEVVATDSAGNAARRSTFVQVDLVPPRLRAPTLVDGPVVLAGLAMDPDLDAHAFAAYELSWRPAGTREWSHEGMRVPGGRGPRTEPWRSRVPQSAEGVLGFWDPPEGLVGEVELRVRVDDGTESVHEAVASAYATSRTEAPFQARTILPDTLRAGVSDEVGWSVRGRSEATPRALAVLLDSSGAPLLATEREGLAASIADGRPASLSEGSLHVWREDSVWTLQANGACRGLKVVVETRSDATVGVPCPRGWICQEDTIPSLRLEQPDGGRLDVDRILRWTIPAGSRESLRWSPPAPSRLTVLPDSAGRACAVARGCPAGGGPLPGALPAAGEVRLGAEAVPVCDGGATIALHGGKDRVAATWDGFRLDGNWPSGGEAVLDVDLWDPASMRVVHASGRAPLRPGDLALGARALGGVVRDAEAPGAQRSAALEYTVEGRAAKVGLSIRSDERVVRKLPGNGTWKEGRSLRRPWTVEWDGTDDQGALVPAGKYRFVVEADDRSAEAEVEVGGQAWRTDSTLRLSFAPTEARWSPSLQAWQLMPPAEVLVEAGVQARSSGQEFAYRLRYAGTQDVVAFRTFRPSLMIRRKRDRVKFGLLWKVTTIQNGYDSDESIGGCGNRSGAEYDDVPVVRYLDGGVVDLGRGSTLTRQVDVHVQPNTGETTWRMGLAGHVVEWVAVPLSVYSEFVRRGEFNLSAWGEAIRDRFATGSFRLDNRTVTPTYGLKDRGPAVEQGTWTSEPPAPRTCQASTLAATDLDGVLDSRDWTAKHCPDVPDNEEVVNPNRNLLQQNLRTIHTRQVMVWNLPKRRMEWVDSASFVWKDGSAGAACAKSLLTDFSFQVDLRIPDRFFDAEPGIDNLANRLLRFDASNRFLYGAGAFLSQDGIDNDGNGRIDDAPEAQGTISPFERRSYEWRPLHSDLESSVYDCSGVREIQVPELCTEVYEGSFECVPGDAPGVGWSPLGEPVACDPNSPTLCQTWRGWKEETCSRTALQSSDGRGNILEDKLNFFEGDHAQGGDRLEMWFTNTPEEGTARFTATVGQGATTWTLDSRQHQGHGQALTIPLARGTFPSGTVEGMIRRQFRADPVRITVGVDDDLVDATSSPASLATIPWPLDEAAWGRAKEAFEAACGSVDPADPSACRRLHLAASGVRLGWDDGLAPSGPGTGFRSLAQERFFRDRAAGRPANPEGLPGGRIPSGSGTGTWTGSLSLDALGRAVHVDSLHARTPRMDAQAGATLREVVPEALPGFRIEGPDARGIVRWYGDSLPAWGLGSDPRVRPSTRLRTSRLWNGGMVQDRVGLVDLYRSTARLFPDGAPGVPLYVGAGPVSYAPNTGALADVRLEAPSVRWRDGSDAASRFAAAALGPDGTGYPAGLLVRRTGRLDGTPEWVAIRGAVPAGRLYQMGWSTPEGGWRAAGAERLSDCASELAATGRCPLGFVDASLLPARGRLLLRVREEGGMVFQSLPFVRGVVLPDTGTAMARSLFGEAEVVFPAGALAGKPDSLRAVSVRLLSPHEAAIPAASGIAVTGPVLEILPSQTFPDARRPEIVLRLPREAFVGGGLDPSLVRLFRVDPVAGRTTLLEDQVVRYFRDGDPCAGESAWTVAEFHARTPSFSRFALLPASVRDARSWSVSVDPANGTSGERTLEIRGLGLGDLEFHWDDDPLFLDASDPVPPREFRPQERSGRVVLDLPDRERSWLTVRERGAGLPRTLEVQWIRGDFAFASRAPDTVVAGVLDGTIRIPYVSSHPGSLRLAVLGTTGPVAWIADSLRAGSAEWILPVPPSWNALGASVSTRLVAVDGAGRTREVAGPELRLDARRPVARLSGSVRRVAAGWAVHLAPSMTDSDGQVARGVLELRREDGGAIGSWTGDAPVDVLVSAAQAGSRIRATLVVEDAGGNRATAGWSSDLVAPEDEALLWLATRGDGATGWDVVDRGRHRLGVRVRGAASWKDGAAAFDDPTTRLETDSVSLPEGGSWSLEVFGAWSAGAILLAREGAWELRREGADVVLDQGGTRVAWSGVFEEASEWRHLVLVVRDREALLVVDGRERGTRVLPLPTPGGDRSRWTLGGGDGGTRFVLARVWPTPLDLPRIGSLRAEATGLDSVLWQEAEQMQGGGLWATPRCELPSRLAVVPAAGGFRVEMDLEGPRLATVAARWRCPGPRVVAAILDGRPIGSIQVPERGLWGGLAPWTLGSAPWVLDLPPGRHRLALDLPEGLELDGIALVSGSGDPARWTPPDSPVETRVEVLARDESPTDPVHFRPRVVVRNLQSDALEGYRLHLQVRAERERRAVAETWWPQQLTTLFRSEGDGLHLWSLDRSGIRLAPGQSDFEGVGPAVGFHHDDWSPWSRANDPVWDSSWSSGAWTKARTVAVVSSSGRLLAPWSCRIPESERVLAPLEPTVLALDGSAPLVLEGKEFTVLVKPIGTWAWSSTVLGISPLDGQPLEGVLSVGGASTPLAGWWQSMSLPNAEHGEKTLRLTFPATRRVQIQKWEQ